MSKQLPASLWSRRNQYILILVLIFLAGFVIVEQANKTPSVEKITNSEGGVVAATGILGFTDPTDCCVVGKPVTIEMTVDSGGTAINGFDGVILFDSKLLSFKSSEQKHEKFDIVTVLKSDGISVAGILKSGESEPVAVNGSVVSLVFMPIKQGKVELKYKFAPGRTDDSNIVAAGSKDILKSVVDTNLQISK